MDINTRLNGLVRISEIENEKYSILRQTIGMRQYSRNFERKYKEILSKYKNKWGTDWMGHFSRLFEYPYVASRIKGKNILDAGSGISFFPWYLTERGDRVWCADNNKTVMDVIYSIIKNQEINDGIKRYNNVVPIEIDISDTTTNILSKEFFDAVYCISVLEHMTSNQIDDTLTVLNRTLKRGGLFLVTFDVGLNNDAPIPKKDAQNIVSKIYDHGFGCFASPEAILCYHKGLYTTEWARKNNLRSSLPWKPLWIHPLKSILQGYFPRSIRRNLACYCGHFIKL